MAKKGRSFHSRGCVFQTSLSQALYFLEANFDHYAYFGLQLSKAFQRAAFLQLVTSGQILIKDSL
jgi:hypothetical protein